MSVCWVDNWKSDVAHGMCDRCGQIWAFNARYLYRDDYSKELCPDCRAKPQSKAGSTKDYCVPWQGDYDDNDNPIKFGKLWKPGVRTCGHSDCVRKSHIVPYPNVSGN